MIAPYGLLDLLNGKYVANRSLARGSIKQLRISLRSFGVFLERPATLSDLQADTVSRFVDWMQDAGRAPRTIKNKRADVLSVWRFAHDEELIADAPKPRKIKSVGIPRRDPDAWDSAELMRLLTACDQFRGHFKTTGVARSDYMRALSLVVYSTGLRFTPAISLRRADLHPDGSITAIWTTQKNRYSQSVQLDAAAMAAVRPFDAHEFLLPGPRDPKAIRKLWRQACNWAGLATGPRQGLQKMRRTAATFLERECPGAASQFLGHTDPRLTIRHYLDPRILRAGQRTPPPLQ